MRTNARNIRKLSHHGVGFYTAEFGLTLAELVLILAESVQTHAEFAAWSSHGFLILLRILPASPVSFLCCL
jgi:hypothetical protein